MPVSPAAHSALTVQLRFPTPTARAISGATVLTPSEQQRNLCAEIQHLQQKVKDNQGYLDQLNDAIKRTKAWSDSMRAELARSFCANPERRSEAFAKVCYSNRETDRKDLEENDECTEQLIERTSEPKAVLVSLERDIRKKTVQLRNLNRELATSGQRRSHSIPGRIDKERTSSRDLQGSGAVKGRGSTAGRPRSLSTSAHLATGHVSRTITANPIVVQELAGWFHAKPGELVNHLYAKFAVRLQIDSLVILLPGTRTAYRTTQYRSTGRYRDLMKQVSSFCDRSNGEEIPGLKGASFRHEALLKRLQAVRKGPYGAAGES